MRKTWVHDGPYKGCAHPACDHIVTSEDGREFIAEVGGAENARIISVAPDLLEACEAQEAVFQHFCGCTECGGNLRGDVWYCREHGLLNSKAAELRRAAIRKAKGE